MRRFFVVVASWIVPRRLVRRAILMRYLREKGRRITAEREFAQILSAKDARIRQLENEVVVAEHYVSNLEGVVARERSRVETETQIIARKKFDAQQVPPSDGIA